MTSARNAKAASLVETQGQPERRTSRSQVAQAVEEPAGLGGVSPGLLAAALGGLLCLSGCSDGDDEPEITLSRTDTSITEESFREQCEELEGKLEVHPSCGGANSCRGMSYDVDTHVYTEHTCQGLNTCRGFSCVLP